MKYFRDVAFNPLGRAFFSICWQQYGKMGERIFMKFSGYVGHNTTQELARLFQSPFPHLAFMCRLHSPVLKERMLVAMGATGKCSAGPMHSVACVLILINFYQ